MITSAFILLFSTILAGFAVLLPAGETLPSGVATSFSWLVTESYKYDYILPITTIWSQIALIIPVLLAYWAWSAVQYLIALIRGN